MSQDSHLTAEQFARYRGRALSPAELLAAYEHLGACAECRERLYSEAGAARQVLDLKAGLRRHLEYEQVVAAASGELSPAVREHLAGCDLCRAEVEDLRQFRVELKNTPRTPFLVPGIVPPRRAAWPRYLTAAAALLFAAGLALWFSGRSRTAVAPPQVASVAPAEAPLPAEQAEAVRTALASHQLPRADVLNGLITRRGVLLGAPAAAAKLVLKGPMGTTVITDRPTFRWKAPTGSTHYVVAVFDENFEKVAESPALEVTEWQPDQALPRGRVLNWQVTAKVGGVSIHAPAPPEPEARFEVVSEEAAGEIEAARRSHPTNHLLLAVLCARAGALEDAGKEVEELRAVDPGAAAGLAESLKR